MFQAEDPGGAVVQRPALQSDDIAEVEQGEYSEMREKTPIKPDDAGIRIDLTRIGGQT